MIEALPGCGFPRRSSDSDVRLAYGQLPDGTIAHIADVPSGLACRCVCPGCGADLVARKGAYKEHHFGHRNTAQCAHALESALHKLAKEVLHDRLEILLPEVSAGLHGRTLITHPADVHRFDEAILEHHLDSIVPDVIVLKGGHRLLVEMYVTHRCGPEKVARIRAMGLSCVEVDLRRLSRRATRDEVERALLADARRYWINNPKLDRAAVRLEKQIEREREDARRKAESARLENERRLDRLAAGIASRKGMARPRRRATPTVAMRKVGSHGFGDHIGQPVEGDECFLVPPDEWQAEIVNRFVLAPLEQRSSGYYDFHASDVVRHLKSCDMVAAEALGFVSEEDEVALIKKVPGYRTPFRVAEAFLWRLELGEVIASGQRSRWSITSKTERGWSDRRRRAEDLERRRADIRSTVGRILQKVEHGERNGFDLERWWRRRHPRIGTSFAQAFEKDDHRLNELAFVVNQMESMLFRGGKIVEDTFDLPVAGAVGREIQARHDREEAERVEAEAAERRRVEERVASLAGEAWTILQHQSSAWLDGASTELGTTPRAAAAESYDGLALARSTLRHHVAELERTRALERLRGRLLSLAAQMRRPEHARVFLTSPHPDWRGRHPIECCVDEKTFEDIRKRMAKIAS